MKKGIEKILVKLGFSWGEYGALAKKTNNRLLLIVYLLVINILIMVFK